MQTGNEGVVHASRASSMAHTYNSSQLDHIFNPMPPSEPKYAFLLHNLGSFKVLIPRLGKTGSWPVIER